MSYSRAQRTQAQKKANELANNAPGAYASPYQQKINSTLEKINSRKPFSYDFNADALYNRYKDLYEQAGETAMMDAQADAAALTGGFENSYGASAGQKAYQQMLQNASNAIPELQNNALSRYNAEGEELYNRLSAYQNAESLAYQKYQNDLNNYYNALDYCIKISRNIDPASRTVYVEEEADNDTPEFLQRIWQNIAKKIPGLSTLVTPALNEWGQEYTSGTAESIFENTVSPGYASMQDMNEVEKELARLYEATGNVDVLPGKASKKIGKDKLKAKEYTTYAKLRGESMLQALNQLVASKEYKALSEDMKAEAVITVYTYTTALSKYAMREAEVPAKWILEIQEAAGKKPSSLPGLITDKVREDFDTGERTASREAAKMKAADGDYSGMESLRDTLKKQGKDDKAIWTSIQSIYKPIYQELWASGDTKACAEIEQRLLDLGLKTEKDRENYARNVKTWRETEK